MRKRIRQWLSRLPRLQSLQPRRRPPAAAVPAFHSLLGAANTLYLDFDGHAAGDAWGTYNALPFNFGGGPTGLYLQALGFATVSARCVNGGFDRAFLFDTAGNDVFSATPQVASLTGTDYVHQVVGFDSVQARSSAGVVRASFSDSAGADLFVVDRQTATHSGAGFVHQAVGFSIVAAQASSSADVARLTDASGNDAFVGRGADGALTSAGWSVSLTRFGTVHLAGTQGGVNRLDVLNLTYILQLTGVWSPV